jgi:hypothetical protein
MNIKDINMWELMTSKVADKKCNALVVDATHNI